MHCLLHRLKSMFFFNFFRVERLRKTRWSEEKISKNVNFSLWGNRTITQKVFGGCMITSKTKIKNLKKNIDFSLWGKQCSVLPRWTFFPHFCSLCATHFCSSINAIFQFRKNSIKMQKLKIKWLQYSMLFYNKKGFEKGKTYFLW